jgi:hypothetical protein
LATIDACTAVLASTTGGMPSTATKRHGGPSVAQFQSVGARRLSVVDQIDYLHVAVPNGLAVVRLVGGHFEHDVVNAEHGVVLGSRRALAREASRLTPSRAARVKA